MIFASCRWRRRGKTRRVTAHPPVRLLVKLDELPCGGNYFHIDGRPQFIECNPRTVEPENAACSGVDLPGLTIALSRGRPLAGHPIIGSAGVRTRGALALAFGALEQHRTRLAVLRTLRDCALRRGEIGGAIEVLTPVLRDPERAPLLIAMASLMLINPGRVTAVSDNVVQAYRISPDAIDVVRHAKAPPPH